MRRVLLAAGVLAVIASALLAPYYWRYRQTRGVAPPDVLLVGMEINGAAESDVVQGLNRLYEEPVAVYYGDERIILRPQTVGFSVDTGAMLAHAESYNTTLRLLRHLVANALNLPVQPVDVPLQYSMDAQALDNWLADVAQRYDRPPLPPQPVVANLTIAPGKPGTAIDLGASRARVVAALVAPKDRSATLIFRETEAPPIDIKALAALLEARAKQFPGIASVFLHHIPTGEEVAIDADVAYAGMSTLKLAILSELYRKLDAPPDVETTKLITETVAVSGNFTANLLLGLLNDGDPEAGIRILNESLRMLGLKNTFMAAPYDRQRAVPPRVATEANSRTDLNTQPDPYMQTTPRDIGLILTMLVQCSRGGGALLAAYADQYSPAECQQALDFLALNEVTELLVGGLPEGTRAVHKHGYVADTHGDVMAVWGPAGPYVLSVFLFRPTWLEWDISNPTMKDLSRAVWNYFELTSGGVDEPRRRDAASLDW